MNVNIISILGRRKLRPRIEIILTSSLVIVLLHQNIFVTKTSRMDSEFAMRFFHLIGWGRLATQYFRESYMCVWNLRYGKHRPWFRADTFVPDAPTWNIHIYKHTHIDSTFNSLLSPPAVRDSSPHSPSPPSLVAP